MPEWKPTQVLLQLVHEHDYQHGVMTCEAITPHVEQGYLTADAEVSDGRVVRYRNIRLTEKGLQALEAK